MDKFALLCTLVAVIWSEDVSCNSHQVVKQIENMQNKIVGGEATTIEEHPYQAYLLLYNGSDYFECGGSIISEYYVLTAAHCVTGIQKIFVRIGSTDKFSGGIQYETPYFYAHPMYRPNFDYDVAVVLVRQRMQLNETNAKPIELAGFFNDPEEGENVTLTGWGDTAENGNSTNTLRAVEVSIVSRERCQELINNTDITSRMICGGGTEEGGKDTCQGDSGGPAVLRSENSTTLVGITSFGNGCGRPNSPGVYTRVGNFQIRYFILNMTGK